MDWIGFIIVIIIAAALRYYALGIIPSGITNDELSLVYNSFSIARTGNNIFGEFLPFLTWINFPFLPVAIYLSVPIYFFFNISTTIGRLPAATMGIADVALIYFLVISLFKNKTLALLSALFLAISPWHLHFSRAAYETNYAIFFYLLGVILFIYAVNKNKIPILSCFSFLLAIYSYRGMNPVFLGLVPILLWYSRRLLITKIQVIIFLLCCGIIIGSLFTVITLNKEKGYSREVTAFDITKASDYVDSQSRDASGPLFIKRIFLNKPMYVLDRVRENYIMGYSPEFLFLRNDIFKIYSIVWSRGRIYFLDVFFIIAGTLYLFSLNRKASIFIFLLIAAGGLPGLFAGSPYSARNLFVSLFLPVLIGGGIYGLITSTAFKKWGLLVAGIIIMSYAYLLGSYLFDYYGRFSVYGAEPWFKSLKDMSYVVMNNQKKFNKVIISSSEFIDFVQYAFYAEIPPSDVQNVWKKKTVTSSGNTYYYKNIIFTSDCYNNDTKNLPFFNDQKPLLYITHDRCSKLVEPTSNIRDFALNPIWKIYIIK